MSYNPELSDYSGDPYGRRQQQRAQPQPQQPQYHAHYQQQLQQVQAAQAAQQQQAHYTYHSTGGYAHSGAPAQAAPVVAGQESPVIGDYVLGRSLGNGTFCKVVLGFHRYTGRKVAVKILNKRKLRKMSMGDKVRTEVHILRQIQHPHIIRLFEVIETQTDIYLIMEYVAGGEFFDYIVSRGRLSEAEARSMFQQIVTAVEYCHSHMVVHRDLKPENLLLDDHNRIKVVDFGLSAMLHDGLFLKTSCGSPNYAAPEVISGNLYAGPEVDVWSCGVILYAAICGTLPFDDENIRVLFRRIKKADYEIPPHVPAGCADLIQKMLRVDPIKRITLAEVRQHPWFQQDLPGYLKLSSAVYRRRRQIVHRPSLEAVCDMFHCSPQQVINALRCGPELVTSRKYADRVFERSLAVSYALISEEARWMEELKQTGTEAMFEQEDTGFVAQHKQALAKRPRPPQTGKWYLGYWVAKDVYVVVVALLHSLRRHNFEWKFYTPYSLKARSPCITMATAPGDRAAATEVWNRQGGLKLYISLYITPKGNVVIDFRRISGQVFVFLDMCGSIVTDFRQYMQQQQQQPQQQATSQQAQQPQQLLQAAPLPQKSPPEASSAPETHVRPEVKVLPPHPEIANVVSVPQSHYQFQPQVPIQAQAQAQAQAQTPTSTPTPMQAQAATQTQVQVEAQTVAQQQQQQQQLQLPQSHGQPQGPAVEGHSVLSGPALLAAATQEQPTLTTSTDQSQMAATYLGHPDMPHAQIPLPVGAAPETLAGQQEIYFDPVSGTYFLVVPDHADDPELLLQQQIAYQRQQLELLESDRQRAMLELQQMQQTQQHQGDNQAQGQQQEPEQQHGEQPQVQTQESGNAEDGDAPTKAMPRE